MLRRRWPTGAKVLLLVAAASGALAFLSMRAYAARLEATRPDVGPLVSVVMAARDLERGTALDRSMLGLGEVPTAFVPPGAMETASQAQGRVLSADVAAGEVLTASRVAPPDAGPVAALVPPGLRAVVVPAGIPAAAVRAGDLVDLLATFGGGRPYTQTVVTAAEVLRVLSGDDAVAGVTASEGAQLILLVGPEDAERIAYAKTFAQLDVAIVPASVGTSDGSSGGTPAGPEP